MNTIIPYLQDSSFDSDVTSAMGQAYDMALRAMHERGRPYIVQEVIARQIVEVARTGERDANQMCARALAALGFGEKTCGQVFPGRSKR